MAMYKHLNLDGRCTLSAMLKEQRSFKEIGEELGKDPTTISKEVRNHMVFEKTGAYGRPYNSCIHRYSCDRRMVCGKCTSTRNYSFCRTCKECNFHCPDFEQETCNRLEKAPYVCNGCEQRNRCTLEKRFYKPALADTEYRDTLSESRTGISYSEEEIRHLDHTVSPLLNKGQSLNHICVNNADSIMVSERTLYRLVDYGVFSARNIDLPRKVRYSKRKVKKTAKVDKSCRTGRDYEAFKAFLAEHPDSPLTELDSVEGKKGGKVLLTIHFVKAEFMLSFIRDYNDSQSVIDIFNALYEILGGSVFSSIFRLLLADNGSEFSNPLAIEFDGNGTRRANVFYCDPNRPDQKGSAERNHEFIRCFIPKGKDLEPYSQKDISTMMDHINSYCRESIGNKCPYDMMAFLYGEDLLKKLGCSKIEPNEVTLNSSIFKH
mgnify:CR=1 FL=1